MVLNGLDLASEVVDGIFDFGDYLELLFVELDFLVFEV